MEATIWYSQMDLEKEEARPGPDLEDLPEERHIWRMPEFPHFPRSLPKTFDINAEIELIKVNVLRVEPLPSGSHRNISVPVQKMVQLRKGKRVGNIPKPLAGGYELSFTHKELSGSGEDHINLRRIDSTVFLIQAQKHE
ncbi:hypothetical protein O181_001481 [Austropuccinia psidii MF-1]|uniref:Uncharacterized protein n=1 Tax=Austropuccinia psidii MF-1 TaxID=1389203 RepID=A0A9Q3BB26_9BASI|nr:hypothetical protein [Austropuccinia psidii MF-1]